MTESVSDIADLTFVTRNADGTLNLWTPERPLDYAAACAMGRDYGAELVAHMALTGDPTIFGAVVRAITRGGEFGSVETGFCMVFGLKGIGVDSTSQPVRPIAAQAA